VLAALVLAATAAAGPGRTGAHGRTIYVNGDSLAVGTAPYLPGYLHSWRVDQTYSTSRSVGVGVSMIRSARPAARLYLVQLGTNDDPGAVSRFAASVRAVVQLAGPKRCVVWPTILRPPYQGVSYNALNHVLFRAGERHRNFRVVRWIGLVRSHPGWLAPDGVHVTGTGYRARAELIAREVRRCYWQVVRPRLK
jgi:hypothetical protein